MKEQDSFTGSFLFYCFFVPSVIAILLLPHFGTSPLLETKTLHGGHSDGFTQLLDHGDVDQGVAEHDVSLPVHSHSSSTAAKSAGEVI